MEQKAASGGMAPKFCIAGTALGYSLQGVTLKFISCSPLAFNGMEKLLCFIFLGMARRSFRIRFSKEAIPGAIFLYLSSVLFMAANKMTTAANAVILQYTNPIFVILISGLFLHHKIRKKDVLFVCAMMGGMVLFFLDDIGVGSMLGNGIAILSGVAMALSNVYAHHGKADVGEYAMINCMISMAVGLLSALFFPPHLTWQTAGGAAFYGIFCSGLPLWLFSRGAPRVRPLEISMLLMLEPVCGPLWVALIVGELPGKMALAGAAVIFGALAFQLILPMAEERKDRFEYRKG